MSYNRQANWGGKFKRVPTDGLTVGEFRRRFAQIVGVDVSIVAVYGAVGDCVYPLSDNLPVPHDPHVVLLKG